MVPFNLRAWIQASRLPSQSYIAFPLLLGQILAWHLTGHWDWWIFFLVQAFGVFDQLYIVYANDFADQETDRLNNTVTPFSGGSRVLVEEALSPATLARAAVTMAILAVATTVLIAFFWQRYLVIALGLFGIALLWAYSYRPIRLSYRGGGEFLQTTGVAIVLPLLAYYAQAGTFAAFPWILLATLIPLNLANAISTALPDIPSDRRSSKSTIPVLLGLVPAQGLIIALHLVGLALFAFLGFPPLEDFGLVAIAFYGIAVLSALALIPLIPRAKPGENPMVVFVALSILANLAWVTATAVALLHPLF